MESGENGRGDFYSDTTSRNEKNSEHETRDTILTLVLALGTAGVGTYAIYFFLKIAHFIP
jgi:hypothetical protein